MGYWPTFNSLSPQARGAYISWLASERNDPDTPIGYVFIYFYGLERRILVDFKKGNVSDDEFLQVYNEVTRLRNIYSVNWSFKQYSARFVEYMCIISPDIINIRNEDIEGSVDSLLFKYRLAKVIDSGEPLSAELAYAWIINHPDYQLRTPARRCKKEFKTLFFMYYSERFGAGLNIKPNKTRLKLVYRPASGSLRELSDESLDLPDPSVLTAPVKQLYSIAEECTDKLDSFSRYLGRKDNSRDDLAGILLLPDELIEKLNLPIFSKFKSWANESVKESFGLVSVKDFWMHTGLPLPEKINKREQEVITSLAEKSGFGIAPDHRFHHAKATVDENLVLFEGGHGDYFKPSKHFYDIGIKLRLGSMVASSDDINHANEIEFLQKLIDHSSDLSPLENKSLHAYLLWRLHSAPNMSGIKARLEKLSLQEKGVVSKILISVALADGKIAPQEVKELEKLYSALGLDKSLVTSDLHHRSSSKHTDIGIVARTSHQTANTAATQSNKENFVLDDKVLAMHETETQDVQNMLGTIFKDDEFEPEETIVNHPAITDYLDENLRALYKKIVQKDEWERSELQGMCSSLGLMLDGAIEALNDWAFDQVDAPLIEDDESIIIDREIADELKEMEE